jgi:hypothetical protein
LFSIFTFITLDNFNKYNFQELNDTVTEERSENSVLKEELRNLATQLDFISTKLQETYEKYLELVNEWDTLIIEFNSMVKKIIESSINLEFNSSDLNLDSKALIFALTNPIRNKLKNFKKIAEVAIKDNIRYSNDLKALKDRFEYLEKQSILKEQRFSDQTNKIKLTVTNTKNELEKVKDDYYNQFILNKKNEEFFSKQIAELLSDKNKLQEIEKIGLESYINQNTKEKIDNLQLENLNLKEELLSLESELAKVDSYILKSKKGKKFNK